MAASRFRHPVLFIISILFYGVVDICSPALEAYINTRHLAQLFIFNIYQRNCFRIVAFQNYFLRICNVLLNLNK